MVSIVKKYDYKYFFVLLIMLAGTIFQSLPFLFEKNIDYNRLVKYSVVELKAESADIGTSYGTAVFADNEGTLITNSHVITYKEADTYKTFQNIYIRFSTENEYREVALLKYDQEIDIAVLKIVDKNCEFEPIKFGDFSKTSIGDEVCAIGNLNNVGIALTKGIISSKNITVKYNNIERDVVQCDLTIAEGNSGGALINEEGELIGITTFRLKDNSSNVIYGICYCVPIDIIVKYIKN